MKKLFTAVLFLFSSFARAGLITGSSDGAFENPDMGINEGVGTSSYTTGRIPGLTSGSTLSFSGSDFSIDPDSLFSLGTLSFFNGSAYLEYAANTLDLSLTFDLSSLGMDAVNVVFDLAFTNTLNLPGSSASEMADIVTVESYTNSPLFEYQGVEYSFEFDGFSSLDANGFSDGARFSVFENSTSLAQLNGRFIATAVEAHAVPTPPSVSLLLAGMVVMLARARKKTLS